MKNKTEKHILSSALSTLMHKIGQTLKIHKWAVILAILASLVTMFPQVYFRIDHKDINKGIEMIPDSPWSPRVREVQDGHSNFGAIYFKEGKDLPYVFQPLGSQIVAYTGEMFGFDINNTILLSRILLPFIAFLLMYAFVLLLSKDKLVALASSSLLLLADSIMSFSGVMRILHGLSPDSFLRLARPVNPAMIYILLFAFLTTFFLFYRKRNLKYGILSAIFLGLNFYNYFYSWTYLYAFGGILGLILLINRRWKQAFEVAGVYIGAIVIAIPCLLNLYHATEHPAYIETSMRTGFVLSHAPVFVGFAVIVALLVFLFGYKRDDIEKYWFGLSLLFAPFITLNQQILTGKLLQEAHYHWFFHKPIGAIFVLIVIFYWIQKKGFVSYRKALAILIIVASFGTGMFVQAKSYFSDNRDGGQVAIERQRYGQVMDWLNKNAQKEAVVMANDEISHITVIYTPLNVYFHRAMGYSLAATHQRMLDVLFTFYRLRGVNDKNVKEVFYEERGNISANVYVIHYRELLGSYDAIPDEKIDEVIASYKETLKIPTSEWLKNTLAKYEVEYIVWDKKNDPSWNLDQYKFLNKTADFGDLLIYTIK